ncbi:collagen alpha-3(VI) chain-like [Mustelus asterias]
MKMNVSMSLLTVYGLILPLFVIDSLQQARKRDIVFLIDSSPGIGRSFLQVRNFLHKVIQELDIGPDKDQVAVVQYSSHPWLAFGLNSHSTKNGVLNALRQLRLKTGRPLNTGAALDYVTRNVFTPSAGSRSDAGASQILILFTAGKSRDDVRQAADAVKQAGIVLIAIGAKNADTSELQQIVSNPDSVLKLEDFQQLLKIQQVLLSKVRAVSMIEELIPLTEVTSEAQNKRDIVFLIDESDYIGNSNLPPVRDFIMRIIENLNVGSDRVRVGLVLYSNTAETEFYLNTYSRKDELLSLLRPLRFKGGMTLNTGKALDFVRRYHFTRSAGSRAEEGVPQFLVLITGGRSGDDIKASADALKRAAIITFTVGARNADSAQLKEMAFEPSLAFNVRDFYSLSNLQEQVVTSLLRLRVQSETIEEAIIPIEGSLVINAKVSAPRKRDIVFLIDGSPGMGRSLFQVRKFLNKVIQELDIGPDEDQVAVVQYSSDPRLEFGLNTHSTKDEVLNALRKLRLKTGRPLNTGAALDYVTRNVFTPSAGGRSDAGASQILVLITAGKSGDDVGQAADAIKQAGIVPIAIGAKSADTSELQQIVSNPDSVLKLGDFQELQTIQQELLSKVRAEFVIEEPIPPIEVLPKEMSERDIVFLIDGSDNVGNTNLPFVRDFMTRIIRNLAIGSDKVRVGLAQYTDDTEAEFYLNSYSSEAELLSHIRSLRLSGGTTANTGSALDFAIKYYFTSSAGSRIKENVPQFLVLVTGGRSSDDVEAPADALKRAAVMTFAVGVKHTDPAQLEEIAIDPSLIFNVKEFNSLSEIHNQIIIPLTTLTVPTVIIEEPTIKPEQEPVPPTEVSAVKKRDIVFLIDGSPGMGRSFPLVREFVKQVIQELDIGPDRDQVAVVQYSSDAILEFGLNTHSTKDEVLKTLRKLRLKTGRPLNTGAALDYVTRNVFTPSAGGRSDAGASQILVLITAGKSTDDVGQAADAVKQAGIVPIAIGAKSADTLELQQIVSNPDSVLKLGDFQELQTIQQELLSKVRAEFVIEEPIPPTEVLPKEMSERDIVFLIDGSDNVGNTNLPFVRDFMTRIIRNLAIGSDKVRVGLAQYTDDTEAEFYLNSYSSETELLSHIRSLRLSGGTTANTGSALDFAIKYYFTSSAGSRIKENVPQFLVLVTGGRSSDDVEAPADALKRAAVMTFAVGVKHTDPAQLEEIAIDPSLIFNVKEFNSLSEIHNQIIIPLTTLTVPTVIIEEPTIKPEQEPVPPTEASAVRKRDIVFLIDGSPGMGRSFLQVRAFLNTIIQELDIGPDRDQVAVVQYSSDAILEFGLNTHSTKDEVLKALRKLRLKTGRPLNTGAALDYVTRNVFTPSAGGRSDAGASQILVLITAGKSTDDVGQAADAVKQAGILPIAIGAKSADTSELQQIVSNPDSVLKLGDFQELQTIQQELLLKVRAVFLIEKPIPPTEVLPKEMSERDIVFLIDGSDNVGNTNLPFVRDFMTRIIRNLAIGSDKVRVGLAQYTDDTEAEFYLNSYSSEAELLSHIRSLRLSGGTTANTGSALDFAIKYYFTSSAGSRIKENVPQFLVLVTGGRSSDDVEAPADALKRAAVMTFAVGVKHTDPAQLEEIAIDPSLIFNVKEFNSLSEIHNQIIIPLTTLTVPTVIIEEPTIKPEEEPVPPTEVSAVRKRDIVFLIDGSPGMGRSFLQVRAFLNTIIQELDIGPDRDQVAVVQYSSDAILEFGLNTHSTKDEVLKALRKLRLKTGRPLNTGAALDYVTRNVFTPSAGGRSDAGASQILVLITAGKSRDDVGQAADAVKQAGIVPIAIGAKSADTSELQQIVSNPDSVLKLGNFQELQTIQQELLLKVRAAFTIEKSPVTIEVLPKEMSERDIVFLIDGSDNVGNTNLPFVRDFMTRIIRNLAIGSDKVRVGLAQYTDDTEAEFYLNSYSSETELLSHIRSLRLSGGTTANTGSALDFAIKYYFTSSAGSRIKENVPQFLVLVTGGRSSDDVEAPADALKRAAVMTFAVGVKHTDPAQLEEIAIDPSLIFNVKEFNSLSEIHNQIIIPLTTLTVPTVIIEEPTIDIEEEVVTTAEVRKRNIVFLIDGSPGMGRSFPLVREFVKQVIQELDIGPDRDQVAVVQYSSDAILEFGLNTHSTKDEVLNAVRKLRLKTGRPLNTGAALDYVTRNVFTPSAGGRSDAGASQILVLITAGKSRDDVRLAADAAKQAGIVPIAIGAKSADTSELQQIVYESNFILKLRDFRELPSIQNELISKVKTVFIIEEITTVNTEVLPEEVSKRDIVFLIDGSDNIGNTNLLLVHDFIRNIIENLNIGSDRVRVGLAQFSHNTKTEFYLNTYSSKAEILSRVKGLKLKGGTTLNTGAALDFVFRNHFTSQAGSRKDQGVPQFLVLFTGGRSMDAVKPHADTLKRAAIATFAVGVRNADPAQLQEIATDPNLVFSVKEFRNLANVQERVMTPLSTLSAPTVTTGESTMVAGEPLATQEKASIARQRDIVFLVDGTLGMGKAFPLVRAFLMRVIQEFDIGPEKDQIAVVQYSQDPKTEFELNTYASKDEVLAATSQLRRKTGRVLNTGAALNYVIRNVFIASAGSRHDTGATQILVLIIAGKSKDDVGQAAFAVKRAGIVPIAIGAKSAHSAELHQIVYSPDFLFVLKTFHTVPTIQQQLISILKSVSVESLEDQPQ